MNTYLYMIFNGLFWVALILVTFVGLIFLGSDFANPQGAAIGFFIIFCIPVIILWYIRFYFAKKFEVRKFRSEKRHQKALDHVRSNEEKKRNRISERSEQRNIDPLIHATRQELNERTGDMTPNSLQRINTILAILRENNDLPSVNELYEIIINTRPERLNSKVNDYLEKRGN